MVHVWNAWGKGCMVGVLVLVLLGGWWYLLGKNRDLVATVTTLETTVTTLETQMSDVKKHVEESKKLYDALNAIKQEVRNARVETDRALDASCSFAGSERVDYLMQLLETDLLRRAGDNAACVPAGGVQKSGRAGSAAAAK